jgi:hypothetical protein
VGSMQRHKRSVQNVEEKAAVEAHRPIHIYVEGADIRSIESSGYTFCGCALPDALNHTRRRSAAERHGSAARPRHPRIAASAPPAVFNLSYEAAAAT